MNEGVSSYLNMRFTKGMWCQFIPQHEIYQRYVAPASCLVQRRIPSVVLYSRIHTWREGRLHGLWGELQLIWIEYKFGMFLISFPQTLTGP